MGVGVVYPSAASAFKSSLLRPRSVNVVEVVSVKCMSFIEARRAGSGTHNKGVPDASERGGTKRAPRGLGYRWIGGSKGAQQEGSRKARSRGWSTDGRAEFPSDASHMARLGAEHKCG